MAGNLTPILVVGLIILVIWETVWKAIAMWKAARNSHKIWYVCILIFNTVGILPIIYLTFFLKNKVKTAASKSKSAKKKK
jgi:hypothetical protein